MPQSHMTDFVRDDACHLTLGPCRLNHSSIDEHRTARQGKRIDVSRIYNAEIVLEPRVAKFLWKGAR
jgi:hypothetical protein